MQIIVKARLECVKEKVEKFGDNRYLIYLVSDNYEDGNKELVSLLSKYFGTPQSRIRIVKGFDKDDKIVEII